MLKQRPKACMVYCWFCECMFFGALRCMSLLLPVLHLDVVCHVSMFESNGSALHPPHFTGIIPTSDAHSSAAAIAARKEKVSWGDNASSIFVVLNKRKISANFCSLWFYVKKLYLVLWEKMSKLLAGCKNWFI